MKLVKNPDEIGFDPYTRSLDEMGDFCQISLFFAFKACAIQHQRRMEKMTNRCALIFLC